MAAIIANDPQIANQAISLQPSPARPPAASPEAGAQQNSRSPGFSQRDVFATRDNSQSSNRADLVDGQFQKMDRLIGGSNAAWSWHQLRMELIRLTLPS